MPCRIKLLNKKTGVTYVYESIAYWDKEKQQARNKRVCVGKLDPVTAELIPSKRLPTEATESVATPTHVFSEIIGASLILNYLDAELGVSKLLKSYFPQHYAHMPTMAYYLVANGVALSRCKVWCKGHQPGLAEELSSQRISEILSDISFSSKQMFCKSWIAQVLEDDYLCYDITSISSYAQGNEYIKYGYNRDNEPLPQLNLAMIFGQKNTLPLYYHHLPGNISDVSTLKNLLKHFQALGFRSLHYIMDKGFYSQQNINALLTSRYKFTIAVPLHNVWLQQEIDKVAPHICSPLGYQQIADEVLYVHSSLYSWGKDNRRCYLHLYYNAHAKAIAMDQLNEKLVQCKIELEAGHIVKQHQSDYERFFHVKSTPKRGVEVSYNLQAIEHYQNHYTGFLALLSNGIKAPIEALQIYREKDVVEKCFDDLKNQLDMKRLRIHSSSTMEGRLFVQFIALIYISALRRKMRLSSLLNKYTVTELFQEMETLTEV